MKGPVKAAASSHIRRNDFRAVSNKPHFVNMHVGRRAEGEQSRQRQTKEESKADRLQLKTGDKLKSPWREGHSRSIADRRCRLSAFITVREAEFCLIVHTLRPWIRWKHSNITDAAFELQTFFSYLLIFFLSEFSLLYTLVQSWRFLL